MKVDEEGKPRLDELQAKIKLETGKKVTQRGLLDRLIDNAYETRADLIDSFLDDGVALSEEEIKEFLSGTSSSGNPVAEEDFDDVLYDNEQLE